MMEELMNPEFVKKLVAETHLSLDGSTGQKNNVSAYFVVFQGQLQLHLKYGKKFYIFNVKEANADQIKYNEVHNLR